MVDDIDKIFNQVKTQKLSGLENFIFEIDLDNDNIALSPKIIYDDENLKKLKDRLPPTFLKFIQQVANGLDINIGNALTIYPVGNDFEDYWNDILSLNKVITNGQLFPSKDFIFFGGNGVGELYAFYTATKFDNGEFPIVWFTPGSVDTNPFVLLNSSFDKFLTIQYYLLKATDYEETYSNYEEVEKASTDKNLMNQDERNWQNYHDKLYDTFDPIIQKPNNNYYYSAITLTKLIETIERTKNNSHQHSIYEKGADGSN